VGKPQTEDNLEDQGVDEKIILKIGLQKIVWKCDEWTDLAQDWDKWQAVVNTAMNLKVCHPRCVRSIKQSCSVYISIYTDSHEHNNISVSSDI